MANKVTPTKKSRILIGELPQIVQTVQKKHLNGRMKTTIGGAFFLLSVFHGLVHFRVCFLEFALLKFPQEYDKLNTSQREGEKVWKTRNYMKKKGS